MSTIWIWLPLLIIGGWFIQNCVHEGSHLLVGWLVEGRKPLKFIPWPHKYNGRLYFARYESGIKTKGGSPAWRYASPLIINGLCLSSMTVSLVLAGPSIFIIVPMVGIMIDNLFWLWTYFWGSDLSDGKRFREIINEKL